MNLTKLITAAVAVLFLILLGASGCTRIHPGHVGVVVNNYGADKGVQGYPAVTGMQWYNPVTTTILEYPVFVQTAVWTHKLDEGAPKNEEICFTTKDQVSLCADISLSYRLIAEKVPAFYVQFRSDRISQFTHGFLYNVARGSFSDLGGEYSVEEAMSIKRADFLEKVRAKINSQVNQYGVLIEQFDFVGSPRPPRNIIDAINSKIQATQDAIRTENELRAIRAEAAKTVAAAEGTAAANDKLTRSVTPQLMEWRKLELQEKALAKWDGHLPQVNGGGQIPLLMQLNPTK